MAEKRARSAQALRMLRAMLLDGRLPAGRRLSESALAERMGVSRTPLREAMAQLVDEGLLERIETGGLRARRLTIDDLLDGIDLRGTVEGLALRRAAERGVPAELMETALRLVDEGDRLIEAPDSRLDLVRASEVNEAFHGMFGPLSGSETIARELDRVRRLPLAAPSAYFDKRIDSGILARSIRLAQSQHRAMLDALRLREGARAEALAREHALIPRADLLRLRDADLETPGLVPGFAMMVAGGARRPPRIDVSPGRNT